MKENIYKTLIDKRGALVLRCPVGEVLIFVDQIQAIAEAPPSFITEGKVLTHIWVKGQNDPFYIGNKFSDVIKLLDEEYPNKFDPHIINLLSEPLEHKDKTDLDEWVLDDVLF